MRTVAALVVAVLIASLAPQRTSAFQEDGKRTTELGTDTIVWRYPTEPPNLNPTIHRDVYGSWILYYMNGYLYMQDKDYMRDVAAGKVKPGGRPPLKPEVAADYPKISEDKLTWTIPIRKGIKWHDGKPVTAHDVKASYDILMHPKVDSQRQRSYYADVDELSVVDDYTVKIKYKKPYYFALYSWYDFPLVPAHVVDELDDQKDWNDVHQVVGCGPYKLEAWKKGEEVILVRNEDYWGKKPNIKRVRIRFIKDDTAAITALRRGEIDIMGIPPQNWERDLKGDPEVMKVFRHTQYFRPAYFYIGWNMGRDLFKNKKVRKALTMLLDIQDLIKSAVYGYARQITGNFYFQSDQYNKDIKPLAYDPEGAKKLLQEAGWVDTDRDGFLDKDGKKFKFEFMITTLNPIAEKIATTLKESFAKAGIVVTIRKLEWGAFLEQLNQDKFDANTLGWSWDWPETDPYQVWHSSQSKERGSNRVKFIVPEADRLIEDARKEFDQKKRDALYHRLHEIIYDEQPYTFLFNLQYNVLLHKRFRGPLHYPMGLEPRASFDLWVAKGEEKYK